MIPGRTRGLAAGRAAAVRAPLGAAIGVAVLVAGAGTAGAHGDPPGCFQTGPAIVVSVFRADGTTGVVGSISECETVNYQATLQKANNVDTICAFSQGVFRLTTPDGVVHDIDLNVPCIGGTAGEGCDPTVTQLQSTLIPYTVDPGDVVGGFVVATATYTGGVVHDAPGNTAGASATTPKSTLVVFCADDDNCTSDACDPDLRGAAACSNTTIVCDDNNTCTTDACDPVLGLCVFTPAPDSTPCPDVDGDACTNAGCEVGQCVQTHVETVCPPDGNPCTEDPACDPQTGQCEHPPVPDSTPCPDADGDACTTAGCEVGACVQTHNQVVCPPDANECTLDPGCNPATGLCEHPPLPDSTPCADADGSLCTTPGCEAGQCVQTHITTVCPPDSNECTLDPGCNPATGLCEHPPVQDSTPCTDVDGNACTFAGCEQAQCVQNHVVCPPPISHFTCYEVKPFNFTLVPGVSLVDAFGSTTVTVNRPTKVCAPADKNDEDPTAPLEPDHLTGYRIRNPAIKRTDQTIVNQFGTIRLDVTKTDLLFVPTAKSLVPPAPPAPADPAVDHFQCYKVKRTRGTPKFLKIVGVKVDDQFGTGTIDLLRPKHLCAPVNKRNEEPGAELHPDHLLCYKVKAPAPFQQQRVSLGNQFGPHDDLTLIRRQEFCVPSLRNPSSTTTSTTTTSSTSTTVVGSPSGAFAEGRW